MSVRKPFLAVAGLVGLAFVSTDAFAQVSQCETSFQTCLGFAADRRDQCNQDCDGDAGCMEGCQSVYNSDYNACNTERNTCHNTAADACRSGCLGFCGPGNLILANYNPSTGGCGCICGSCAPPPPPCPNGNATCSSNGWYCNSPILIDPSGNGFDLTDAVEGVLFDLHGTGEVRLWSWTASQGDDGWLTLDRNGNGVVDNGTELFGSATEQPASPEGEIANGFSALGVYDQVEHGGNADGLIDARDAIFQSLRLWQDVNHNGSSEEGELHPLLQVDVARIDLSYNNKKATDEHGNEFRFRARVWNRQGRHNGRWAWDVFLVPGQ